MNLDATAIKYNLLVGADLAWLEVTNRLAFVRLGWHPNKDLELSLVGQNLLHDHHLEYVIASPNPRVEIVRSAYGKVTWRF